ncbi:MAG TPA: MFS transporter [Brevundimonas sp.]|uniref:MFS transporter n=1 Tax=Brevundimonas sp. TaxID=1871086 RepID=UPI002603B9AC|nr:MFS transporter [Brevundimonas sp.]HRO34395.1 MFS transporter [Brevundimonas sp.]
MTDAPSSAPPVIRRSNGTLAAFAASCLPYAALGLPVYVTLPEFYASHVGVPLAAVSLIFLIVRLADIVVDPVLGVIIDRTSTRWGRYRVWMAIGAPILMLSVAMLFFVAQGASATHLAVWLVVMYLGYSISLLSQMSWAAVLSPDYDQRSRIYGWWQVFNILGVLAVLLIPVAAQAMGHSYVEAVRMQGGFIVVLLPLALLVTFLFTPEPRNATPPPHGGLGATLRMVMKPVLRRLLISDLMLGAARGLIGVLFFYFFEQARGFEREQTSILLLVYFVAGLVGAPVWAALATRIGKHRALAVGSVYFAISFAAATLLVPAGNFPAALAAIFGTGLAFGAADLLLRAMMADASDAVRLDDGADRTGLLFSILNATSKMGYALSVGAFAVLEWIGFDAQPGAVNDPGVIAGLQWLFIAAPVVLLLTSALVLRIYPLTPDRHAEIRARLAARDGEAA